MPQLKILLVAAEAAPFAKAGGVADVIGSLPKALAALGHDVRVFIPRHGAVDPARWGLQPTGVSLRVTLGGTSEHVSVLQTTLPGSSIPIYLLEHEHLFAPHGHIYLGQDQRIEQERFLLFCRSVLDALPALGFVPDIIHLNDWHTAACAVYSRTRYRHLLRGGRTRIVYTIHNLQYQGRWDPSILVEAGLNSEQVFVPGGLEFWGDVNWMKGGIVFADVVTTVSRRYAEEIQTMDFGWGLDEVLFGRHSRLFGIPNGIDWDEWNPLTDTHLAAQYDTTNVVQGKAHNREALRQAFGLPDDPAVPLIGIVSRLVDQKGFDLLEALSTSLAEMPLQLVVLGSGQPRYEDLFERLSLSTPNVRARIGFDDSLSHLIYAGSDFFLMPSAFEPGGIGQLIALRYGTLPVVRSTGGLADSVTDLDIDPAAGNGISFVPFSTSALAHALDRALGLYKDQTRWPRFVERAMDYDSHWSASAHAYSDLYERALRLPPM